MTAGQNSRTWVAGDPQRHHHGHAAAGDQLPSARNVAAALGINLHTVLRGYQQLREEGLVDLRRGRAAVITAAADQVRLRLTAAAEEFARAALHTGTSDEEAVTAVRDALLTLRNGA
ncbi:GntR family transcriptional regulator [Acrocarpospora sp. B8E8]|uniref:GntR family transcriptional regulator n=1 Tax=Acrocarpospora sp. B8E8 TaxID=3153572 RepID=UPI00325E6BEC